MTWLSTPSVVRRVDVSKRNKKQQCPIKRIECLGGVLVRSKKHLVYKMPDGFTITVSRTASCARALRNIHADISRWEKQRKG